MSKPDLALRAACLIVRAHRASKRPDDSHNEVYWHTRELLMERCRGMGLRVADYLLKLPSAYALYPESEVLRLSEELWPEFCHPEELVREVMET